MARAKYNRTEAFMNVLTHMRKSSALSWAPGKVVVYEGRGRLVAMTQNLKVEIFDADFHEKIRFYDGSNMDRLRKLKETPLSELLAASPVSDESVRASCAELASLHDSDWVDTLTADANAIPAGLLEQMSLYINMGELPRENLRCVFSVSATDRTPSGWVYTDGHRLIHHRDDTALPQHYITLDTVKILNTLRAEPMFTYSERKYQSYVTVDAVDPDGSIVRVSAKIDMTPPESSSIGAVFPHPDNPTLFRLRGDDLEKLRLKKYADVVTRFTCDYDADRVDASHSIDGTPVLSVQDVGTVDSTEGMDVEMAKCVENAQSEPMHFGANLFMSALALKGVSWNFVQSVIYVPGRPLDQVSLSRPPLLGVSTDGMWRSLVMPRRA